MVVYPYNPSTLQVKAGGEQFPDQPELYNEPSKQN